jgi:isopenicillin N synthase-like dioxygenase
VSEILDVDLMAFERGDDFARRAVVDGVRRSLETGFVYTAHDLPEDLLDEAYGLLAAFFSLPAEVKGRFEVPESHSQTGYTGLLIETAAGASRADWKEMLNWGADIDANHPLRRRYPHRYAEQVLPEGTVPGIRSLLMTFHHSVIDLQERFLRVVALGLGCDESFFDDMLVDGPHLTRAIHYPEMSAAPSQSHIWADAHKDINLITALPRSTGPGLQLLSRGKWIDVTPPTGHVVVNTGIMLERLTNGRFPAGVHRVVSPDGADNDRYSVVQFCHPAPWYQLAPLPSCVDDQHPLRYGSIEAGALLDRVLFDIGLMEGFGSPELPVPSEWEPPPQSERSPRRAQQTQQTQPARPAP